MGSKVIKGEVPEEERGNGDLEGETNEGSESHLEGIVKESTDTDYDGLFQAACRGYKPHLEKLLDEAYDNGSEYVKTEEEVIGYFMFLDIQPMTSISDKCQLMSSVDEVPDDVLSYVLDIDEKELDEMGEKEKKNLISSVSEAGTIRYKIYSLILSPGIMALSAEPKGRPLLGAALYLAQQDDVELGVTWSNEIEATTRKSIDRQVIPTGYIKKAAKKYHVGEEMYLSALKGIGYAKKRYEDGWL